MYTTYSSDPMLISMDTSVSAGMGIWLIIATILSIIGGVLVYFLFVKAKTTPKGKFMKWLKDFLAFKTMWLEPILKVMYYIETIAVVLISFAFISTSFLMFLGMLILGPIITRLIYEMFMMFVMVWHNTQEIAESTKKK